MFVCVCVFAFLFALDFRDFCGPVLKAEILGPGGLFPSFKMKAEGKVPFKETGLGSRAANLPQSQGRLSSSILRIS